MDAINKFSPGLSYGPVLSQTDLYLLKSELELNPILSGTAAFHLVFNIPTGQTGGFNPDARDRDLAFTAKDEPATIPRVSQLIIITEISPWCTIVKNERGVTLGDVCTQVWKDYSEQVTDAEFAALPARLQDQIKRSAASRAGGGGGGAWGMYYTPAATPSRFKRYDWLRERAFFERLLKKDSYAEGRLGYKAPNIFVMELTA